MCNNINSFSPYAIANMRRTSGASMFMTGGEPNGDARANLKQNEARRIHCDPQTKSPQSNTLLQIRPSVSIRFTTCHEHACSACPTHVCYCIWRKRVYIIAHEGFWFGGRDRPCSGVQKNETLPAMVSSNWVGYIVCNTP